MIDVQHFSYSYGSHRAVDDISFHIKKGEIVSLIGPNGAGKSTTMKVLTTLMKHLTGDVSVCGFDVLDEPMQVRRHLGYLPETNPLYDDMIVFDALRSIAAQRFIAAKNRDETVRETAALCGLSHVLHQTIDSLSRGYRQRVGLAQAIMHKPDVLILDEPTTGLDPNQIVEIRDLILEIGKQRTVLLSTHILQEVAALSSRVIILNHGKIAADGNIDALMKQTQTHSLEELFRHFTLPTKK